MVVSVSADAATVLTAAKADEKIAPALEGMQLVKELYVPGKLVNLVVRPV
jgi:leucyl-tRNA synthetase